MGIYSANYKGADRILTITAENMSDQTIVGTWSSTIDGHPVTFDVKGSFVKRDSLHERWLLTLSGSASVHNNPGSDPAILYAVNAINGFSESRNASDPIPQH